MANNAPKPVNCRVICAAPSSRRSPKKAAGMSSAKKNTMPFMTSFKVAMASG